MAVNDDVNPQRAPLADDEASLTVEEEEPSDRADMDVESAIAAMAGAATECRKRCLKVRSLRTNED